MRWLSSVRSKIMGTVLVVSGLGLGLGAGAAIHAVSQAKQRGRYLEVPCRRYAATLNAGSSGDQAAATLLAHDPGLMAAFVAADAEKIKAEAQRLAHSLEGTIAPERAILSDAAGNLYPVGGFVSPYDAQWRESRMYQDLILRGELKSSVAIIARTPYRISGSPIRAGDRIVGAVVLAKELESYLQEVAKGAAGSRLRRNRLALVSRTGVLASSLSEEEDAKLFLSLQKPVEVPDGDATVPVLRLGDTDFDYWAEPLKGYDRADDPSTHEIGQLVLMTERTQPRELGGLPQGMLWVFLAALGCALAVGYVLAVVITHPLRRYIQATEGLVRGQGDLTKRLDAGSRDELGVLAQNLNRVFAKIHTLAAGVQRTAFQVNASSGEISAISKQMLDGAKEQAAKISNSTAAATELSSSIQQVAENAAEATRTARQSGEAVTRAIGRLGRIRSTVDDAAHRIGALGESGKRIGNIVEVIRQISEQTTMLALNAAIEAAHAGEHGRGFAVVADEVSSLAKRTGQSAKDIEDLIATIRDQTSEAVHVMQDGTREVEEGTRLVEATLADLQTLISVIKDTAAAVQEQAIASDEIARNMDVVQRIGTEVLRSSEHAVSQGDRLLTLADELEQSVQGFKIDPARVALDAEELKALPETGSS
jgi:methyl-accepting chemotaxis protein